MSTIDEALAQGQALHSQGALAEAEAIYRQVLAHAPGNFTVLYLFGVLCFQQGRGGDALSLLAEAVRLRPDAPQALAQLAVVLQAVGRNDDAAGALTRLVEMAPGDAGFWSLRGQMLLQMGRAEAALESYDAALKLSPDDIGLLSNRGIALRTLKRFDEALDSYDAALSIDPHFVDALNNRATVLRDLKRLDEALSDYSRAIALAPQIAEIHCYRGRLYYDFGRHEEALAGFDAALRLKPDFGEAWGNRGAVLEQMGRQEEALESYARALPLQPGHAELPGALGSLLLKLKRPREAHAQLEASLAIAPNADIFVNRGVAEQELGYFPQALASFDAALALSPGHVAALNNRGFVLLSLNRPREAAESFDAALAMEPDDAAISGLGQALLNMCDWARVPMLAARLRERVTDGKPVLPLVLMGYDDDPALALRCARLFGAETAPPQPLALWLGDPYRHTRIRVAYLSSDLHEHATAYLMAGLFEAHDRRRFETFAISWGPDDGSALRQRLVQGFDHFHDVRGQSDEQIARLLRKAEVDIAVDLKGYTQGCRPGIFAHRPCPLQVHYLGFPGTMGMKYFDYVIGDAEVTPFAQEDFYAEKIVQLEGCYQVNDARRVADDVTPERGDLGLPNRGFVFCCFNNSWKITRPLFDIWMRVLKAVDGSVLWLIEDSADAKGNLQGEAAARGIDPARLVFAPRLPLGPHLARQRQADLFLDTLPYNAHTTASDALWMGVPLVTCRGQGFAGRAAASLLEAVGLGELITDTLDDYESLILALARDAKRLQMLKDRLARDRDNLPLFDTQRFARTIEAAYMRMWNIAELGGMPESFRVGLRA